MSGPDTTDTEYPAIQFNPVVSASGVEQTRVLTGTDGTEYFPTGDHNIGIYMLEPGTATTTPIPYTFAWEGVTTSATQYSNVRATLNANRSATSIHKWTSFTQYGGVALTPANRMTFGHASASTGKTADFYAYYPHVQTASTPINAIPFTLSIDKDVTDILYACHTGFSYDTDVKNAYPVQLDFRHALSLISFKVINQGKEDVIVSGGGIVDVVGATNHFVYTKCTMDLTTAKIDVVDTNGTNGNYCKVTPDTPGTRSTTLATNVTVPKHNGTVPGESAGDIVNITLPYVRYSLGAQPEIRAYLTVSYATSSTGGFATSYGTLKVPEITPGVYGFQQGYKYSYEITVTSTGISFGDVKIAEWVGATTQPGVII